MLETTSCSQLSISIDELCDSFGRILQLSGSESTPYVSKVWKKNFEEACKNVLINLSVHKPLEKWLTHWNISLVDSLGSEEKIKATYFRIKKILESSIPFLSEQDRPKESVDFILEDPVTVTNLFASINATSFDVFKGSLSDDKLCCPAGKDDPFPKSIPVEIASYEMAKELLLESPELDTIPPQIGQLKNLSLMWLTCNTISSISKEMETLPNLDTLILKVKDASKISRRIWKLPQLTHFTVECSGVFEIPSEIRQLKKLKELCISAAQIRFSNPGVKEYLKTLQVVKLTETKPPLYLKRKTTLKVHFQETVADKDTAKQPKQGQKVMTTSTKTVTQRQIGRKQTLPPILIKPTVKKNGNLYKKR